MAAFHFVISPPVKKLAPKKVEKLGEEMAKLTLAPFSGTPEIKFGEVLVNSKATKNLIIHNPSVTVFVARFGNTDLEDRIFINGCDIKSCEIILEARQEMKIEVTWGPIHSGYLRKIIRIFDVSKKARSFDVILRGMAINTNNIKNVNSKKLKENNKVNHLHKTEGWNSTITLTGNQKKVDTMNTFRRQTYTIHGKENLVPDDIQITKSSLQSSSPIFSKETSSLNILNENSAVDNFSIQSFPSYVSVDAPMKYSNFESELELSVDTLEDLNPINFRRSTALHSAKEKDDVYSSIPDQNYLMDFDTNSFWSNQKDERLSKVDISTPVRNDKFLDRSNENISHESKIENMTFDMRSSDDADVFLTPQKNFVLDSLILSSLSKLGDSPSFISKSSDCLNNMGGSSFKASKRDDLFFISPPRKTLTKGCKRTPEDPFPHRSGSSAISDRKKLLKTSFLSRKRTSPSSALKNRGPRRISAFNQESVSTVEKVKNCNPLTLKQAVSSHCQINDPFLKQVLYNEDKWAERQEKDIIKWMNSVLVPPFELSEETNDWTVNAADVWLRGSRLDESSTISVSNKIPPLYSVPQKLNILRKRKNAILKSEPVKTVFQNLSRIVDRKIIFVRDDRDLHADEGLKKKLLHLLSCFNPIWLRMGLEAVYDQEIALQPKADVGGLGLFIRKKLLYNALVNKRNINSSHDHVKKSMLLTFLKLVYFLDYARMQKLIRHNRCLFTQNSSYKSSQDLLSAFCADLVVGRGYVMKHLKAINYNLQFKQTCVDEYNYWITSLEDLRDGIRLTRLFEILFMEPDLCSKLRIPAIDIENKKHNVEVAMKVARSRCTIEGNITPEDIVLGRAGNRMKTLSFLWQIINNYLTPLYERAASKIQKWWRIRRMHCLLENFVRREKEKRATVIQSAWKGYLVRKLFRNTIVERKRKIMAVVTIQRQFRAYLLTKRERVIFKRVVSSSIVLQSWYRCMYVRRKFVELRRAVVIVQRRYRANKLMIKSCRQFRALKCATIFFQRLRRANIALRRQRNCFLMTRRAAITIQRRYQEIKLFRAERNYYVALKMCTVNIQRRFRANCAMKYVREQYLLLRNATLNIQRRFRGQRAMLQSRNIFLNLRNAVIKIQRRFRANRLMRIERSNFLSWKHSAVVLQQKFRATQLMKAERLRYLLLKCHVVNMQRLLRANNETKMQQCHYLNLKRAAIIIQRKFRANRATKFQRCRFLTLKSSAIVIQRRFRAIRAMKIERDRYSHLLRMVTFVQRLFLANQKTKIVRMEFHRRKNAAICIQRRFRAQKAAKSERRRYLLLKQSVLNVQRKFRDNRLAKLLRNRYTNLLKSVIYIQRKFRANRLADCEHRRYISLRNAVVIIQQKFRANQSMRSHRNKFLALKTSAVTIQQKFRANLAAKLKRSQYTRLRMTAIFLQRKYRANKIGISVRCEYLRLKTSTIIIQTWYRSSRLMQKQRADFCELKHHAIKIQRIYRGSKLMRLERKEYEKLKTAATCVQRRYRALCMMREKRSYFLKLKNLTNAIKTRYVALREIRENRIRAANRKLLSSPQITRIGPLQLRKYNTEQRNAFNEMLKLRAEFLKLKMTVLFVQGQFRMKIQRNQFLRTRSAATRIQRWWRFVRRLWLTLREVEENFHRVEKNAATKIQALWRGYSVRKRIILPVKPLTLIKKDKENPDSKGTLGERYKRAIDHLKTSDMYNVITIALWNLETVTTFSAKLCEGVALEGIVPIIFSLVSRGNRSEPSIELYRASFSILINLARYAPTKVILWDNMDKDEDVLLIMHIMKMTHDKFQKKNDIEVFRNSATLLWLLCQDARVARRIASVNTLRVQIHKMMETLSRKCSCIKNPKSRRSRTLPKIESNWYADSETRIFSDNCFALSCIYNSLFNQ